MLLDRRGELLDLVLREVLPRLAFLGHELLERAREDALVAVVGSLLARSRQERVEPTTERAALRIVLRRAHNPYPHDLLRLGAGLGGAAVLDEQLACEREVALRALRGHVVEDDRLAVRGRLGEADVARDDALEDEEVLLHLLGD